MRAPHRRRAYVFCVLVTLGLAGTALVAMNGGGTNASANGPRGGAAAAPLPSETPTSTPTSTPPSAPTRRSAPTTTRPTSAASASTSTSTGAGTEDVPMTGNGVFTTAKAAGSAVGSGTVRRYEVRVEEGTGVSAGDAAREIEGILGDPRGWTADGHDAFQLVSRAPYDFVVKIATPATVDTLCGAAGLHTHGEVNCDVGSQVIVNLKRWNTGSPEFPGPLHDYRALIINHEVGHRIGHGHEGCPGPGRPAPAMMQQIDGLHGCAANAWPYDSHGTYLSGPPVP